MWQQIVHVNDFKDQMGQYSVTDNDTETKFILFKADDGQFSATSHLCTHYKAPLTKGSLHGDRIMCPWHGACFNIKSGNVEDGPALDSLKSYPTKVENGIIYIDVSSSSVCKPKSVGPTKPEVVLVAGGGPCALVCVETLRKENYSGVIKMVSPDLPIDTPKLSKVGNQIPDIEKLRLRDPQHFKDLDIEWVEGMVTSVNEKSKRVTVNDAQTLQYDYLVLATGSIARQLPFLKGFSNSFTLRSYDDAKKVSDFMAGDKKDMVICGSSFIGLECAAAFSKIANSITVVGMESVPLEVVLGKEIGKAVQLLHEKNNVKFRLSDTIDSVESENGAIKSVHLKSGDNLNCDIVIAGIGAIPNTNFLDDSFSLNKNKSINVNKFLQVKGFKNVFAGGDIAQYDVEDKSLRIEHWNVAQNHGRTIAYNIINSNASQDLIPYEHIPYFWTVQFGKSLRYCGHARPANVVIQGNIKQVLCHEIGPDELKFRAYFGNDSGNVEAVASLMWDPVVSHASELFRTKKMPPLETLKSSDILSFPFNPKAKGMCF
eukprot:NODE_27_length_39007_cov_1.590650.p7 type:complete len:543 gc:universal NODE_27_length_39007_cov_1.590650:13029-11401(-)